VGRLFGKIALVTGGANGQGAAISKLFAKEGAIVIVTDIAEEGRQVAEEINQNGGHAHFMKLDVSKREDWEHAISFIEEKYQKLDVLVNNAGMPGPGTVEMLEEDLWHRVMDVNAKSVYLGMKASVRLMKKIKMAVRSSTILRFGDLSEADVPLRIKVRKAL